MTKVLLPGAWELLPDQTQTSKLFPLQVPIPWQQVAKSFAQQRAERQGKGYRSVPVYSLDPVVVAIFPQIVKTIRKGWQQSGLPWLFAKENVALIGLPDLIKDWLREEFSWYLGDDEVDSALDRLDNDLWRWSAPINDSILGESEHQYEDFRFQTIPDFLAEEFLKNREVAFGIENQYRLKFYRVVNLEAAELMSWPPHQVTVAKDAQTDLANISFVIRFFLHTVPWRCNPIVYPKLSVRRWIQEPLIAERNNSALYKGVKVHIGDNRRWIDGERQSFCFIPLNMKLQGGNLRWPRAIRNFLELNDSRIPSPIVLAQNPVYHWSVLNEDPIGVQAAIAYTSQQKGEPPCQDGVSPLDLASLDRAVQERLPVRRVGEAVRVSGYRKKYWRPGKPKKKDDPTPKDPNEFSTVMLRPNVAAPAVFRLRTNPLKTILILWETADSRDVLIAAICQLLLLAPKGKGKKDKIHNGEQVEENIYEGQYGKLCIKTQHVGELTQNLDVGNRSTPARERQRRRKVLLEERANQITAHLPPTEEFCGALVEIKRKPFVVEADPKLAWRIGAARANYLNQHLHKVTFKQSGEGDTRSVPERAKSSVSDLLRQFGILPAPIMDLEKDGIEPNVWLTCLYVLRRTQKTTVSNKANTVILVIRVHPIESKVEVTTPSLWEQKTWVSYPTGLQYLLSEKWEPDVNLGDIAEETDDETTSVEKRHEQEQRAANQFLVSCLRDCLNTPIVANQAPRVLLMAVAQKARRIFNWLQNPNLPKNDLPQVLKLELTKEEINYLWVVRLRESERDEVPVVIAENSPGSRWSGIYHWQKVGDNGDEALFLSLGKLPNSAQNLLDRKQSRLDDGKRDTWNARGLEIAVIHSPEITPDRLANFVHRLRDRWPYYASENSLPFPFPFATTAREYAVSAKDLPRLEENGE